MQARNLLYKGMVISPAFFIAWLGINGRFLRDSHEFVACTKRQHQIVLAYRHPVQVASMFSHQAVATLPQDYLIFTTSMWRSEYRRGGLYPINPAEYGASIRDGVHAQIASAGRRVVRMQIELAARAQDEGDLELALDRLIDAYEITGILKYSDPVSVTLFGGDQRLILGAILDLTPRVSPPHRAKIYQFARSEQDKVLGITVFDRKLEALEQAFYRGRERPSEIEGGTVIVARAEASTYSGEDHSDVDADIRIATKAENSLRAKLKTLAETSLAKSSKSVAGSRSLRPLSLNSAAPARSRTLGTQMKSTNGSPLQRLERPERRERGNVRR